jgi:hypothetical protein
MFGAGKALGQRGNVLGLSLLDLFKGSLTIVAGIGVLMAIVIFFPPHGSRPDPPGRRGDRPAEQAAGQSGWSGCSRASTSCTRVWWRSTARGGGWRSSGARC